MQRVKRRAYYIVPEKGGRGQWTGAGSKLIGRDAVAKSEAEVSM